MYRESDNSNLHTENLAGDRSIGKGLTSANQWAQENGAYMLKLKLAGSGDMGWRKRNKQTGEHIVGRVVRNINAKLKKTKRKLTESEITDKYGESINNSVNGGVRSKQDNKGNETINMAGPMGFFGASDSGEYKIDNNVERAIKLTTERVNPVIEKPNEHKPVLIYIKGHSRNAVASSRLAVSLMDIYRNRKNVNVALEQFDPVPGPLHFNVDSAIDFGKAKNKPNLNTVLIQSLKTEHNFFFSPQEVFSSQRHILIKRGHEVGLYDNNRYEFQGKTYGGFSLVSLPPGIYLQQNGENDEVIKIKRYGPEDLDYLIKEIRKSGGITQIRRTKSLEKEVRHRFSQEKSANSEMDQDNAQEIKAIAKDRTLESTSKEGSGNSDQYEMDALSDYADPRLVKYCTWNQVPYLSKGKKHQQSLQAERVNNALFSLKRVINTSENPTSGIVIQAKNKLKTAADKYTKSHVFVISNFMRRQKTYCKLLSERIKEENKKS